MRMSRRPITAHRPRPPQPCRKSHAAPWRLRGRHAIFGIGEQPQKQERNMSAAQRAGLTTRRSLLSNAATLAVALPVGRAGAAGAVASAPSAPLHLAQAGTAAAAASSGVTTKSTRGSSSRALSLFKPSRRSTRLTVAGETPVSAAICLPVQRWRGSRSTFRTTSCGVGQRSRRGRELRSRSPARPSARYRATHLRMVRGQTPTANAAAFGVCPLITCRTIRSRP
jgi:hypothetical protein